MNRRQEPQKGVRIALLLFTTLSLLGVSRSHPELIRAEPARTTAVQINVAEEYVQSVHAPLGRTYLTSGFGPRIDPITHRASFHKGIDLAAREGTPIVSIGFGTVAYAGEYAGYGKLIVISHGGGLTSHYGHCNEVLVHVGQSVAAGSLIGKVGHSGRATGPHLHFETRLLGRAVNAVRYFSGGDSSHFPRGW